MTEIQSERYFQPLLIANTEGLEQPVKFIERMVVVKNSVTCDVYEINGEKDLAIIHIAPNGATPLQQVIQAETITLEEHVYGEGKLVIKRKNGEIEVFDTTTGKINVLVNQGDYMQWQNTSNNAELTAFEVCYPPYQDGRYHNLTAQEAQLVAGPFMIVPDELIA